MINDLNLTGNKLNIYALIHGFSRVEGCYFTGSLSYISKTLKLNKRTIIRLLKELVDEGLIIREDKSVNNLSLVRYKVNQNATGGDEVSATGDDYLSSEDDNLYTDPVTIYTEGDDKMSPNNTNNKDIYINTKDNNPPLSPKKKNNKIEYAKGVKLLPEEYSRLVDEFGEQATKAAIEYLSLYKQEKGYKTKEDNLTIRRWVMEAANKKKTAKPDVWQEAYNYIHSKYDKQPDGNN